MNLKGLLAVAILASMFSGCAQYMVSGGDQAVLREAATMPMGVTFSEKEVAPKVDQLPIKINEWSALSREVRAILKPYVHTSGDYLPVSVKIEMGNQGTKTQNGFGGGEMVIKQSFHKNYGILITSWTEDADILLDIPVSGSCTAYRKTKIGGAGGFDSSYVYEGMNIADQNAIVSVIKKLDENRAKINELYKEYQKSKEVF